jgi:hypothetical protein
MSLLSLLPTAGKVIKKVVPKLSPFDSAHTLPPCDSTGCLIVAKHSFGLFPPASRARRKSTKKFEHTFVAHGNLLAEGKVSSHICNAHR